MTDLRPNKRPGRKFVPTDEQRLSVQTMAGHGIPHKEIALTVINPESGRPIDDETLRSAFRHELDIGHVLANNAVVASLYAQAVKGNTTACIWWTKARLGWRETVQQQFLDQDGNPTGPSLTLVGRPADVAEMPQAETPLSKPSNTRLN